MKNNNSCRKDGISNTFYVFLREEKCSKNGQVLTFDQMQVLEYVEDELKKSVLKICISIFRSTLIALSSVF